MDTPPPLTPLTKKDSQPAPEPGDQARMPFYRVAGRMLVAILIWLAANLIVFIGASFLIFVLLGSLGIAQEQELFTLSIVCAIPLALTVSGLIAGRRIYYIVARRYK